MMKKDQIQKIVNKHRHEKSALLAILHEVQEIDKQLDTESLKYISQLLNVPYANIYGLATFYSAFSTSKKGETVIRACDGIACHINGADEMIETLKSAYNLKMDETAWDGKASLEKVHCLGLCSIGPNVSFNNKTYSKLNREKLIEILQRRMGESK